MSNRVMWSIGLLVSAVISIFIIFPGSIIGWGIGSIFFLIFLLMWAFSNPYDSGQPTEQVKRGNDPLLKRVRQGVEGSGAAILVALMVSLLLAVMLPAEYVSWVLLLIGVLIGAYWFVSR